MLDGAELVGYAAGIVTTAGIQVIVTAGNAEAGGAVLLQKAYLDSGIEKEGGGMTIHLHRDEQMILFAAFQVDG
jgi:hypothetical protein